MAAFRAEHKSAKNDHPRMASVLGLHASKFEAWFRFSVDRIYKVKHVRFLTQQILNFNHELAHLSPRHLLDCFHFLS